MSTNDCHTLECPHCYSLFIVYTNEIACAIFRHAILKESYTQINPHASKEECERLITEDKIYGCGKPFRVVRNNELLTTEICDYI